MQPKEPLQALCSKPHIRKLRGYVLISSLLVLAALSAVASMYAQQMAHESRVESASRAGVMGAQFKQALRALIAREGTGLPTGNFTGTGWLKDSGSCAGATGSARYLPCEFPDFLPLELAYNTTVTSIGGVVTATVQFGIPAIGGDTIPTLAGRVVAAINGTASDYSTPATQTYYAATNNVTTGNVSMVVTNAQENLEFLKRDGTVLPTADFDWNNFSISNANNLSANNTITAGGDINAGDDITAVDRITGNTIHALGGRSEFSTIDVSSIRDRDNTGYTLDLNGTSNLFRPQSSRTPTAANDLANKAYVDSVGGGHWGGSYFYSPGHGGCYRKNPISGSCSCPSGYTRFLAYSISISGCYPCTLYQCYRN